MDTMSYLNNSVLHKVSRTNLKILWSILKEKNRVKFESNPYIHAGVLSCSKLVFVFVTLVSLNNSWIAKNTRVAHELTVRGSGNIFAE